MVARSVERSVAAGTRGAAVGEATRAVCRGDRRTRDMYLERTRCAANEMRGYAADTVDVRWAGQVASLGAGVWWGSDAEYLGARQARG